MPRPVPHVRVVACLLASVLTLAAATDALAQMAGIVRGTVTDGQGKPVEGAKVTLAFQGGLTRSYETTTDKSGVYAQIGLAPGPYAVTASKEGIGSKTAEVTIKPGARMTVNLDLAPVPATAASSPAAKAFQAAVAASKEGRHTDAIAGFEEALRADPACYDCQYNLGLAYTLAKQYDKAEAALEAAKKMKPEAPEPLEALAAVYNATRRFDQAARASEAAGGPRGGAAGGGVGSAGSVFDQGLALWNAGKLDEALAKFNETLKLDPNHGEAHYWLGMGHLNQGRMTEAAQELELYIAREPGGRFAEKAKALLPQIKKPAAD